MSKKTRRDENLANIGFINFFAGFAKGLMVLVIAALSLVAINVAKYNEDGIRPNAEFTIEVHWPDGSLSDVDTWLQIPDGDIVFYQHRESGLVFLDRDDIGLNDFTVVNGRPVISKLREEITSIRGFASGEYILNVQLYSCRTPTTKADGSVGYMVHDRVGEPIAPIPVTIVIKKINPMVTVVFTRTVEFTKARQELHVVRFTISPEGEISGFNIGLPTSVVSKRFEASGIVPPSEVQH